MADKSFGLKQINMIGVGTPTVESSTDLIVNTNGSERVRITSTGNVGIGTDNPKAQTWRNGTALDVYGGAGNVVGNLHIGANRGDGVQTVGSIVFYDNTQDTNHKVISIIESDKTGSTTNQRGGTVSVYVKEDATVSSSAVESATFTKDGISFPSGKGIDFSATANGSGTTTSELLDDYEEGTWVPSLGGTTAYYTRQGFYTKIGNLVYIYCNIHVNTIGTGSPTTIAGLPFTPGLGEQTIPVAYFDSVATSVYWFSFRANLAGTLSSRAQTALDGASAQVNIFGNATQIVVTGVYQV